MDGTYQNCHNLTGSPICGNNVTSMRYTYSNCYNLTGSPTCGDKVTDMAGTYSDCYNLTGSPMCGDNVVYMVNTYVNCYNLNGNFTCGPNIINMNYAFYKCNNLGGNGYIYSYQVQNARNCFGGKNNSIRLNLFVHKSSTTAFTFMRTNTYSLVGANITWTNDNNCFYNTIYNIYLYQVDNVYNTYMEHYPVNIPILQDFVIRQKNNSAYILMDWKQTTNGVAGTKVLIPYTEDLDIIY